MAEELILGSLHAPIMRVLDLGIKLNRPACPQAIWSIQRHRAEPARVAAHRPRAEVSSRVRAPLAGIVVPHW